MRDAHAFSAKSHIVKHWMTKHPSLPTPPRMDFSITARFRDCLSRQIGEALRISGSRDSLLNSKAEYLSNSVSRLTVKEDAWVLKERQRVEEEEEETTKKNVNEFKKQKAKSNSTQSTHETATVHVEEPCENDEKTAKQYLQPQAMDIMDNGYIKEGQREVEHIKITKEGERSVNVLTGTECNTVYETDDEEFDDKLASSEGESSVNTLTGTVCNTIFKTDDDEREVVVK